MDEKSEFCLFVGYPKGTRGYYFYNKFDMKVFVSTNAKFMEEEYIMNHTVRDMNEWTKKTKSPSIQDNVVLVDPQPLTLDINTPNMPCRNGTVIRPLVKLTLMVELSLKFLESHEDDHTNYYETINDKDSIFWEDAMHSYLKSSSGPLWFYLKGLNTLVLNGRTREIKDLMEKLRHIKPDWWQKVTVKNQVLIMRKLFCQWP